MKIHRFPAFYFSNSRPFRYKNLILQALDWAGRSLASLSDADYDILSQQTSVQVKPWHSLKIHLKIFAAALLAVGLLGALLRYIPAKLARQRDGTHYVRHNRTVSSFISENKAAVAAPLAPNRPLRFLTLNIACLPRPLGIQLNRKFLRPNLDRVHEIADRILGENKSGKNIPALDHAPDLISFQEAFDMKAQELLIQRLKGHYPYVVHRVGKGFYNAGSGLMVFSKYPIIETTFRAYTNTTTGEESLANKGFLGCKIKVSDQHFVTLYNTHLQAGGTLWKRFQFWWGGTVSARRGEECGEIARHKQAWEKSVPKCHTKQTAHLTHLTTLLTGDTNLHLGNQRQMLSVSSGNSKARNKFSVGKVKYPGQHALFKAFNRQAPVNYIHGYVENLAGATPAERKRRKTAEEILNEIIVRLNLVNTMPAATHEERCREAERRRNEFYIGTAPDDATLVHQGQGLRDHIPVSDSDPKLLEAMLVDLSSQTQPVDASASTPTLSRAQVKGHNNALVFQSFIRPFGNSTDHFAVEGRLEEMAPGF